jgi:hypothetical protein
MPAPDPFAFYTALPVCPSFADVVNPQVYTRLPDDWVIVIGDVEGSTAAIARGQYKDVNLVGSSLLIAAFNALGRSDIPFVFGGDGATLALPAAQFAVIEKALLATRQMARDGFALDLRVGVVPIRDIRAAGHDTHIARVRLSDEFALAAFWGAGLAWAEKTVKDPQAGACYRLEGFAEPAADTFRGLECRWRGVRNASGETLALLIQSTASTHDASVRIYMDIIRRLREIFGDQSGGHPITVEQLHLAEDASASDAETKIHRSQAGAIARALFKLRVRVESALGVWLMRNNVNFGKVNWGRYTSEVVRHSDFRKFDGVLRMVLAATPAQRAELVAWLDARQRAGELAYGIHVAQEALVTCLIFEREGEHLHFIDGAGGGYALASADLKARLAAQHSSASSVANGAPNIYK